MDREEHEIDPVISGLKRDEKAEEAVKEIEKEELLKAQEENAKNQKSISDKIFIYFLVGIAVVLVMIFLVGNVGKTKSNIETFTYNGFTFNKIGGSYYTQVQIPGKDKLHTIEMRNGPVETEGIPVQASVKQRILGSKKVYMTVEPNLTGKTVVAMIEVGRVIGDKNDVFNIPAQSALLFPPGYGYDNETPIITCLDSSANTTVIWFKTGEQDIVYSDPVSENCIIVQGTDEMETIKSADRLVYYLLGIVG